MSRLNVLNSLPKCHSCETCPRPDRGEGIQLFHVTIPDCAVVIVARRRKPKRNVQLERFCDEGISIDMLRSKIVKQAVQQGFSSRSRWLLHNLGLGTTAGFYPLLDTERE